MTKIKDYTPPKNIHENLFTAVAMAGFTVMLLVTPFCIAPALTALLGKEQSVPFTLAAGNIVIILATAAAAHFMPSGNSRSITDTLQLRPTPEMKVLKLIGIFCAMTAVMFILMALTSAWAKFCGYEAPEQSLVTFAKNAPDSVFALLIFSTVILAPVSEELLFRYALFNSLATKINPYAAIICTAFVFALMHFNVLSFLPLFLMGTVLETIYIQMRSITAPILLHSAFNAMNMIMVTAVRYGLLQD